MKTTRYELKEKSQNNGPHFIFYDKKHEVNIFCGYENGKFFAQQDDFQYEQLLGKKRKSVYNLVQRYI